MKTTSLLDLARECKDYPRVNGIYQFPDSVVVTHTAWASQLRLIDRGDNIEIRQFNERAELIGESRHRRADVPGLIRDWADH